MKLTKLQRDMLIRSIDGTATAWTIESAEVLAGLESIGLIEPSRQWRHCWRITDLGRAALQSADKKEDSK